MSTSGTNPIRQLLVSSVIQEIQEMALRIEAYTVVVRENAPDLEKKMLEAEAHLRTSSLQSSYTSLRRRAIQAVADDDLGALAAVLGEVTGIARSQTWRSL
jgi:hypothetical protein